MPYRLVGIEPVINSCFYNGTNSSNSRNIRSLRAKHSRLEWTSSRIEPTHTTGTYTFPYTICQFYWSGNWMFYLPAIKLGICMILLIIAIVWHSYLTMKLFCHRILRSGLPWTVLCNQYTVVYDAIYTTYHGCQCNCGGGGGETGQRCFGSSATRWQMHYQTNAKTSKQSHHIKNQSVNSQFYVRFTCIVCILCVSIYFGFYSRLNLHNDSEPRKMWLFVCRSWNCIGFAWNHWTHCAHLILMIEELDVSIEWRSWLVYNV